MLSATQPPSGGLCVSAALSATCPPAPAGTPITTRNYVARRAAELQADVGEEQQKLCRILPLPHA